MRTVYLDVLVAVNIFVDFFLLLATRRLLHIRAPYYRLILGGAAGGAASLAALLPRLPPLLNLLLDAAAAAAMVFLAFGRARVPDFIKRVAVYFAMSFLFSGIMLFVCTVFKPGGVAVFNDVVYFNISPVLLIILTLLCYYILRLIKRLAKRDCAKRVCSAELTLCGKTLSVRAMVDSGCAVREPFSGAEVVIAEAEILQNFQLPHDKIRIIPFESLGGDGVLRGYPLDKAVIDGRQADGRVYLGVCEGVLKGEVRAIVPSSLTK